MSDTGGREGGGGGGGMESESVRRERRMESARGRVHLTSGRARVHTQQFRFLFFAVQKMAFLSDFAEQFQLSSNTIKLLKEEAVDCETAVLGLSEENIKDLEGLKLGERAAPLFAAASLQSKAGGGPLVPVSRGHLRRPRTVDGASWTTLPSGWRALASAAVAAHAYAQTTHTHTHGRPRTHASPFSTLPFPSSPTDTLRTHIHCAHTRASAHTRSHDTPLSLSLPPPPQHIQSCVTTPSDAGSFM